MGLITNIEDLNPVIQEKITNALKTQIEAQALDVYNNLPDKYNDYLKTEIAKAENSMLKMIEASRLNGAILPKISEIYVWNKERKRCLEKLLEESVENAQQPQHGKENAIEQYITGSDKETTMQAIKSLVCGKKGKQAAVIIAVAVSDGYMSKAKFDILKEAFGIDGTKQAFNHAYKLYTETNSTRKGELDAAKAALKRAIESAR